MRLIIAITSLAIWGAAFAVLPDAIDTTQDNDKTLIIEHKLSLIDEQIDDEQYEQSEKAANARHANDFIKNNRSDSYDSIQSSRHTALHIKRQAASGAYRAVAAAQ